MTLTSVPGIRVGHAEVPGGGSGCTVVMGPFRGAVEVRGLATGTRELGVLSPHHLVDRVNAILLTGGSAFGLAAADGVMEALAERGEGFETGVEPVPLVPAAVIFDLAPGVERPGEAEGRKASEMASGQPVLEGRVGVGAGATVGKILGPEVSSHGGVGSVAQEWKDGTLGVLTVVNALGEVLAEDGSVLAGPRAADDGFPGTDQALLNGLTTSPGLPGTSTTLTILATDLPLSRVDLGKVAKMAAGAYPRAISPVNTPFDGDLVFSVSTAVDTRAYSPEDLLSLGVAARMLTEESIRRGVS